MLSNLSFDMPRKQHARSRRDFMRGMFLATVLVERATGAGPSYTGDLTGTNSRLNAYDTQSTGDTTNPIVIPASATAYSYGGWFVLNCTVAPVTGITNVRWYADSSNPFVDTTNITMYATNTATYAQSTGTPGVSGDQIGSTTVCFANFTAASPMSVATLIGPPFTGTGLVCNYVVQQIAVLAACTTTGATNQATNVWLWDES